MIMKIARSFTVLASALLGAVLVESINWEATLAACACTAGLCLFMSLMWDAE